MLKKLYITVLSVIFALTLIVLNNPPAFITFSNERTVYLGSSSEAVFEEFSALSCVNKIKGECCKIPVGEFDMDKVISYYSAEQVMTERVGGTVSYYFLSPKLKNSAHINGKKINLHIAINNDYVIMGTPIIYSGY